MSKYLFCTLYRKLGVNQSDSLDKIKEAYIRLAKLHHPDTANSSSSSVDFKDITNAYNILKDPLKRQQYDASLGLANPSAQRSPHQTYQRQHTHSSQSSQFSQHARNFDQHYYNYQKQKAETNLHLALMLTSGALLLAFFLHSDSYDTPPNDSGPKSYQELKNAYDKLNDRYYTRPNDDETTELRRQNVIFQNQNLNDPPYVIEKRRSMLEQEMKQKKFTIEVEHFDNVLKGDVRKLQRKSKTPPKPELKNKAGDMTIEGFAHNNKLKLSKSQPPAPPPVQISISHLEQGYI